MPYIVPPIQAIGHTTLRTVAAVGRAGYLAVDAVRALRKGSLWVPHLLGQMAQIGVESLPIDLLLQDLRENRRKYVRLSLF
jgi:ABC-type transporter Mla maintaining outer membrane lipid asymmetry permease subunit MlaE